MELYHIIVAVSIFIIIYSLIISEKINRTTIAAFGAAMLLLFKIVSQEKAIERIKPYPLALQELGSETDVVKLISKDLEKFRNAMKSKHIERYLSIANQISSTFSAFEDTFLNYNIPDEKVDKIFKKILALELEIDVIREIAKQIYPGEQK